MNERVYKSFNDQVQAEFYSAYLYLAMSMYMAGKNFKGMAHWLYKQYEEEREHALKLVHFMQERGAAPVMLEIAQPPTEFGTPLELFQKVLEHEKYVTSRIHAMYEVAAAEKDYAAVIHLQWFVSEQVEEEDNAGEIVAKLEMVGNHLGGILAVDRELAGR